MKIGFTGTRKGMTRHQASRLQFILAVLANANEPNEFHHGGASGADKEGRRLAVALSYRPKFHATPQNADDPEFTYDDRDWVPKPPLERNRDIVACSQILIAAPEVDKEILRSGTWATVRYARQRGIPIVMLPRGPFDGYEPRPEQWHG